MKQNLIIACCDIVVRPCIHGHTIWLHRVFVVWLFAS